MSDTTSVLGEVAAERVRQNAKWGQQNHPDGTGPEVAWGITGPASWAADQARRITQQAAEDGCSTWLAILREEVAEAFAEDDAGKLREELVQVAAVAVQWLEAIDRRAVEETRSD